MRNAILRAYYFFERRRTLFWVCFAGVLALCVLAASRIRFEEDITKILNFSEETKAYSTLVQNSKTTDKILLRIYPEAPGRADVVALSAVADSLAAALKSNCGDLLADIRAAVDMDSYLGTYEIITRNFPVFVEGDTVYDALLDSVFADANLRRTLRGYVKLMETPGSVVLRNGFSNDPANLTLPYFQALRSYRSAAQFQTIDGHLFARDSSCVVVMLYPAAQGLETFRNKQLVDKIDETIAQFRHSAPAAGYGFDYFGGAVVAVGNAAQIRQDTMVTVGFLLLALLLLVLALFDKKRMPAFIFLTVGFGFLFSLAVAGLFLHSISLIAVGTGAMVLGVVIDYPIHFFTHYTHKKDMGETLKQLTTPLLVGSVTTIGGFLSLTFTSSELLRDLGIFGACCLLGAVLFTLFALPHLVGEVKAREKANPVKRLFEKIVGYRLDKNRWAVLAIGVCTPVLLYFSFGVKYDSGLDRFNYMSPALKQAEQHFLALSGDRNTVFLISQGRTTEEALANSYRQMRWTDSLRSSGYHCSFLGVTNFIPPAGIQRERVAQWNNYWAGRPEQLAAVRCVFADEQLEPAAFAAFFDKLSGAATMLSAADYRTLVTTFGNEFLFEGDSLSTVLSQVVTTNDDYEAVYAALQQSPYAVTLNTRFIADQLGGLLNKDFYLITVLTSLFVFLLLLLAYGRIELAVTAFLPMVISWVWILGLMSLLGIAFNVVNITLSAFIFGLGADYCVFILDSHLAEYKYGQPRSVTVRKSVYISALTSMIGLGSLLLAKHPALHSLGVVSVLGIVSVFFVSQTIEPVLFRMLIATPVARKQSPVSLLTVVNSCATFLYFFIGCMLITVLAALLYIIPGIRRRKKLWLHYLICYFVRSLLYGTFVLRKVKINTSGETFERPGIIICNHQSMLDILYLLTLHPKLVLVTKSWVWNSPVMGFIVRMAGFHTVDAGMEHNVEAYRKTIAEGYSIALFPEGSRSADGRIGRFHKGAFYLAEQLQLDIIPLLTHGSHEALPKGSFGVRPGQMVLKIYPRLSPADTAFGATYVERAKRMAKFYRQEQEALIRETATDSYCYRKLRNGFMYKGGIVENYVRIKVPLERYYAAFDRLVPVQGDITDLGCGYGLMSYMLWLKAGGRRIKAYDYDGEKVAIAAHCYFNDGSVRFYRGDITQVALEPSDCFIVSDVLHYLPFEEQRRLLAAMAGQLAPGGTIIVRDADEHHARRYRFNRVAEFFSTKVLGFNKATTSLRFCAFEQLIAAAAALGMEAAVLDNAYLATNKIMVLKKRC